MATLDELVAQTTAVAAAVTRIDADFQALKEQLATLPLSPEDQAKVDAAVASLQQSVDAVNSTDPAPPVV